MSDITDPRLLAAHPDPSAQLGRDAVSPPRWLDDGWLAIGRPDDVAALMQSADAVVTAPTGHARLAPWLGSMARFTEGPDHARLRELATQVIASLDPVQLRDAARLRTMSVVSGTGAVEVDLVRLARRMPVETLAAALGLGAVPAVVEAVDALVQATAPATAEVDRPDDESVDRMLRDALGPPDEATAARLSVLFQAMDATAALIMARLLHSAIPPILTTTRRTVRAVAIPSATVPPGTGVVVGLGAATTASDESFVFGRGRHRCPGEEVAQALADGVVDAVDGWGRRVRSAPIGWQPRPNLRIPTEPYAS
jgi:cytochrome P450